MWLLEKQASIKLNKCCMNFEMKVVYLQKAVVHLMNIIISVKSIYIYISTISNPNFQEPFITFFKTYSFRFFLIYALCILTL